jgi:dethiobiotin synthetase
VLEGAGGLLVPLNRSQTWLDFLKKARPSILVAAHSGLGTINHSLLTWQCLRQNDLFASAFIFCGPVNADNMRTVENFSGVPVIAFPFENELDLNLFDPDRRLETCLAELND